MQQVLNTLYLHFAIPCPLMVNLKITITTVPRNIASHLNIIPMKAGAGKKITHKKKTQENYILSLTNLQADTQFAILMNADYKHRTVENS